MAASWLAVTALSVTLKVFNCWQLPDILLSVVLPSPHNGTVSRLFHERLTQPSLRGTTLSQDRRWKDQDETRHVSTMRRS